VPIGRKGDVEGVCPSREKVVEGRPEVQACSKYVREKWSCVIVRKENHGMVEIKMSCFR
jgi:hypothetical protein